MTLPGTRLLSEGLLSEVRNTLMLKLFVIADRLTEGSASSLELEASSTVLQTVRNLKGRELWENATAFLWYSVHCIYEQLDRPTQLTPLVWRVFLCQVFDSFFCQLQNGDTIHFHAVNSAPVVLPRLAIAVHDLDQVHSVSRMSNGEIRVDDAERSINIRLNRPGHRSLVKVSLPNGAHVLTSARSLLPFDEEAERKVARLTDKELPHFIDHLLKALELITLADAKVGNEIESTIKWYWPIYTPDKRMVHNSFSINPLHGAIFLSEHYSYLAMAEAMVHEFYHNQLSLLMTVDQYFNQPDQPTLYSPWRKDPRPLFGLYHGIYVFTGLLEYYQSGREEPKLAKYHDYFRIRQEEIYFQLRTAITQVPKRRLRQPGEIVFEELCTIVKRRGQLLGLQDAALPKSQLIHSQEWMSANPGLEPPVVFANAA